VRDRVARIESFTPQAIEGTVLGVVDVVIASATAGSEALSMTACSKGSGIAAIAATATGAIPFARTFEDRRSPRRPSWAPRASFSANLYRVATKLERRKKSRRRSHVTSPRTPITRPTANAATEPSHVKTWR